MQINSNIPIPDTAKPEWRGRYPFSLMKVGDSIDVDATGGVGADSNASRSAHNYGKRHGWKFAARSIEEGAKVRIWRIA